MGKVLFNKKSWRKFWFFYCKESSLCLGGFFVSGFWGDDIGSFQGCLGSGGDVGFSDVSSLFGSFVQIFVSVVGGFDGGFDSSYGYFGISWCGGQSFFNQIGNFGVGFSNFGFDFFGQFVFGFGSDGDYIV